MVKRRWTTAAAVAALVLVAAGGGFAAQNSAVMVAVAGTTASDADLAPQVSDLAGQIAVAIEDAEAKAKADGLNEAQTQAAIQAAIQTVIAASGQSPRVVESALVAVRRCPTGVATSTANMPASTLVAVHCADNLLKPLSNPALLALGATEDTVLALLDSDVRPASLGGDEPGGGLTTPPSGGLASGGGSDYLP